MFYPMISIAEYTARGQLRAMAVSTAERSPDFPVVPTMAEAGYPGFEDYTQASASWRRAHAGRLGGTAKRGDRASLAKPRFEGRLRTLGAVVAGSSPRELSDFLGRRGALAGGDRGRGHHPAAGPTARRRRRFSRAAAR